MTEQRKTPAEDERWRRRHTRAGKPTEADAPRLSGRDPVRLPGQTDIWQQLDEIAAEQRKHMRTLDWSQFDPDLLARNIAARESEPDSMIPLHPDRCGPCPDCAEFLREHGVDPHTLPRVQTTTVAALVKHAQRFGGDGVIETAREYLDEHELREVEVEIALLGGRRRSRYRRTSPTLAEQVIALAERGIVAAAIADTLSLSDRRVRSILTQWGHRENGGRKWLDQAADRAGSVDGRLSHRPTDFRAQNGSQRLAAEPTIDTIAGSPAA